MHLQLANERQSRYILRLIYKFRHMYVYKYICGSLLHDAWPSVEAWLSGTAEAMNLTNDRRSSIATLAALFNPIIRATCYTLHAPRNGTTPKCPFVAICIRCIFLIKYFDSNFRSSSSVLDFQHSTIGWRCHCHCQFHYCSLWIVTVIANRQCQQLFWRQLLARCSPNHRRDNVDLWCAVLSQAATIPSAEGSSMSLPLILTLPLLHLL